MRNILILILLVFSFRSFANLDNCLKDAKTNGNHMHAINPSKNCSDIIKSHPEAIKLKSPDESVYVYGLDNMFFIEQNGKTELMAGDQTELNEILKFSLNIKSKKLLVLQKNSISIFSLDFIGNVAPIKHFKSSIVSGAKYIRLMEDENLLAIISSGKIRIVNADAETRYKDKRFLPQLIHDISSEELSFPSDVVVDDHNKIIYVLDGEKLLSFKDVKGNDEQPLEVRSTPGAKSLVFTENKLFYIKVDGQQVEVSLTK